MDLGDFAGEGTVSDEDGASNANSLGKALVGTGNSGVITLLRVVCNDLKSLAGGELDWLVVSQHSSSDLWSLGVEHDGAGLVWSLLEGLSQVVEGHTVSLVVTVGEVQSADVKSRIE